MAALPLPQFKDQLSQLFANLANPAGAPTPGPTPPMAPPSAAPPMAAAPAPPIQQAAQPAVAPPSDDPAITGQKGLADSQAMIAALYKQLQTDRSDIAAVPPVDMQATKPHWYDRLLGGVIGTAAGWNNNQAAGPAADAITFRKRDQATLDRQRKLDPLQQRQQADEKQLPVVQAANEGAWRDFSAGMDVKREKRLQEADDNTIGSKRATPRVGPDGKTHYYQYTKGGQEVEVEKPREVLEDDRKREEDQSTPAPGARPEKDPKGGWRVKTKSGDYMPWSPKTAEEGALLGDSRSREMFDEMHRGPRDPAEKKATPGQFNAANRHKAVAIAAAHKEFAKATEGLDPGKVDPKTGQVPPSTAQAFQDAHSAYNDAVQEAQNAYEEEVDTLGGSSKHVEINPTKSGFEPKGGEKPAAADGAAPEAAPAGPTGLSHHRGGVPETPPASKWDGKESPKSGTGFKRLHITDPKTGIDHVWDFKNGKPVMVR